MAFCHTTTQNNERALGYLKVFNRDIDLRNIDQISSVRICISFDGICLALKQCYGDLQVFGAWSVACKFGKCTINKRISSVNRSRLFGPVTYCGGRRTLIFHLMQLTFTGRYLI